ncbi:hypothetical protein [Streptomyces sp. NPDC006193]|uniref:hypothetical protein n=1 Tax=Streptomyces sp. NPDC006193 TaxID=3155717 RepID=UPI00339E86A0
MGIELVITLVRGAGTVAAVRRLLFQPSFARQAGQALAAVGQESATRLFQEAVVLPPREQQSALHQVAALLEAASTADDPAGPAPVLRTPAAHVFALRRHIERLMWLAVVYRALGHRARADRRVEQVRRTLPVLAEAMDAEVYALSFLPGTRTGSDVPARLEAAEARHRRTLDDLTGLCDGLAALA